MAELQSGKKLFREFFDILAGKGRKLDEAAFKPSTIATLETLAKRAAENQLTGAPITKVEKAALNSFTSDVLEQIKKTNGAITPQSVVQLQEAYSMALTRAFDGAPGGTAALKEFKDSIKSTWAEKYGSTPAKVEVLADKRAEREVAKAAPAAAAPKPAPAPAPVAPTKPRVEVADEVVDAPTPPPRAAAPTPEADVVDVDAREVKRPGAADGAPPAAAPAAKADNAPPAKDPWGVDAQTEARVNAEDIRREKVAQVELQKGREQDRREIRLGMAVSRGDVSQGLLDFESASTYEAKLKNFDRINGKEEGGKQIFAGIRRTGWIPDNNDPKEMYKVTQHYMTSFTDHEGKPLFDHPTHRKLIQDYVQVEETKRLGKAPTAEELKKAVDDRIETFKVEFEANKAAGKIGKLEEDGLRSVEDVKKMMKNRTMTPLADDNAVVDNPPGAWIKWEEWGKVRTSLVADMRALQLKTAVTDLRDISKQLDTVDIDLAAVHGHFDLQRSLSRSPELRQVADLTDMAKYEVAKEKALAEGKAFTDAPPPLRKPAEIRDDIYAGKLAGVEELNQLETFFRANKLQTEAKVQVSALRDVLKDANTLSFKIEGEGGVRDKLNQLRAIERRPDYQALTVRSASAKAHDDAVEAAASAGTAVPDKRKVDDVLNDLFNGNKITNKELYQLEEHYKAVFRATQYREEVNQIRELLRREGTVDFVISSAHPRAAEMPDKKGLHERFERLREIELIPGYQEHYPISAAAAQAVTDGRKRAPQEILDDLYANNRVSRAELNQLETHYQIISKQAEANEFARRAVNFPHDPTDRAAAIKEFVKSDNMTNNIMLPMQRRIEEIERMQADLAGPAATAARTPTAGRPIHEVVQDVTDGKRVDLADAKVFSERYKTYLSGEALAIENKMITDRLMALYEPSNGPFRALRREDKAVLKADFETLRRNMDNPAYKVYVEHLTKDDPDLGKQVRRNLDTVLGDLQAGNPINPAEITRMRQFFERWHNADRDPPGRIASLTGARFWDRRLDSLVLAPTVAGVGAVALAGGMAVNAVSGGGGNGNGLSVTPGGPGAPSSGLRIPGFGADDPSKQSTPGRIGRIIDRVVTGTEGAIDAKTAESITYGELMKRQDQTTQASLEAEAGKITTALQGRSAELGGLNLNALAGQVAERMKTKFGDQKMTMGEGLDAYEEAIDANAELGADPTTKSKVKGEIQALRKDLSGSLETQVLPGPRPQ